jgi:hypothetical protein
VVSALTLSDDTLLVGVGRTDNVLRVWVPAG